MRVFQIAATIILISFSFTPLCAEVDKLQSSEDMPKSVLTLHDVLTRVEQEHPLLQGSQTQKMVAAGKVLKALGKFEPTLVNDWELERLIKDGSTKSVGFNDTFVEMLHPWGIKGFAGFRAGIGDVQVADLAINNKNQPLLGIVFPILRGLRTNPAHAELQKSELADKQADLEIQQARQDLYLGAATQFWNWVAAWKFVDLQQRAVTVAETRWAQLAKQASTGARAQFDVIEANEEFQRRREMQIKAERKMEAEQYRLALFLWEGGKTFVPEHVSAPEFPSDFSKQNFHQFEEEKKRAVEVRPEIHLVNLEAEFNHIDLEVAENDFLPDLTAAAEPTRKPGEFVLGLGYRFGVQMTIPFLQRGARGDLLQMEGKAQRLKLLQRYRMRQVTLDVDNAQSAIARAKERIQVSRQALQLAQALEKGERTRFKLGATSLVFVNLRERNVIQAAEGLINALAEYQKALALYQWAIGGWVNGPSSSS